jgi:hypothetical protein
VSVIDCKCLIDHMRAKPPWTCPCECHTRRTNPMMPAEDVQLLAVYNSERARGIVHTQDWVEEMAQLQRVFDTPKCGHIGYCGNRCLY